MQRESRIAHYVVGVLTAGSLVLLSLPLSSPVRSFKACVSYVLDPIPYQGERGIQKLAETPSRVRELLSADMENRRLQEELRRLAWLKADVESLGLENIRLRGFLVLPSLEGRGWGWVAPRHSAAAAMIASTTPTGLERTSLFQMRSTRQPSATR